MQDNAQLKITISDGKGWDAYVVNHGGSFIYHLYGWGRAVEEAFGLKNIYLQASMGGKICGILPLSLVKNILGQHLISVPIGVYAGPVADTSDIKKALIDYAIGLTRQMDCGYLEIRSAEKIETDLLSKDLYVTFIKALPGRKDECLENMPRKARAVARHAIGMGLSYDIGLKHINTCYEIYAVNQRMLGSPVVSKQWFLKLAEVFKDKTDVLVVKSGARCIASALILFYKDVIMPFYGASLPAYEEYHPNNFMYLKLQEYGIEKGFKYFDFGRSRKEAGSYFFKINQGFDPVQLHYYYYLNKAKTIPEINPSNRCFDAAKTIWKYMPLSLTNWLGPKIFKYVMP